MSRQIKPYVTPEEYLALERKAEYKSEYLHGEIFAMTGASRKHNLIAVNILGELHRQLKGKPCEVYPSKMRVKVAATGLYTYPDVVVVCGEPQFEDDYLDTLINPTVLFEVLSKTTERYDRIAKSDYYRRIESLTEHLLVAQDEVHVAQFIKQADGQRSLIDFHSVDATIELDSISCSLALREVYDKVSLDKT
jgi:Uma2 family endonuclease